MLIGVFAGGGEPGQDLKIMCRNFVAKVKMYCLKKFEIYIDF